MAALDAAGLSAGQRVRSLAAMERGKPRRGRKPEIDAALWAEVAALMAGGIKAHPACARVTRDLPETLRSAAMKRLYRRARAIEKEGQQATAPRKNLASGSGARPYRGR